MHHTDYTCTSHHFQHVAWNCCWLTSCLRECQYIFFHFIVWSLIKSYALKIMCSCALIMRAQWAPGQRQVLYLWCDMMWVSYKVDRSPDRIHNDFIWNDARTSTSEADFLDLPGVAPSGNQTYLWPLTLYTANVAAILGYQNSLFPRDPWVLDSTNK